MDKLTTNEIPKSVIVAGNGKSLAQIDYSLLPEKYDVFRCNQFYFEDSYYLGKRIKSVFFNVSVIVEQYYTLHHLIKNKEYTCDNIVLSSFSTLPNESENTKNVKNIFPDVINGYEHYISKLKDFDQYLFFKEMFEDKRVTSGVYMVAVAVAQGYKDIYLTGIDFYLESKTTYVFDHKKKNLLKLLPSFGSNISHSNLHNKNTELEALFFLKDNYNVNIYCISPDSPLFEYFPAPTIEKSNGFNLEKKSNYIDDIMLPPKSVYKKLNIVGYRKRQLYSNLIFRLVRDLLKLPSALKHYLKEK